MIERDQNFPDTSTSCLEKSLACERSLIATPGLASGDDHAPGRRSATCDRRLLTDPHVSANSANWKLRRISADELATCINDQSLPASNWIG